MRGPAVALALLTLIWGYNWVVMKVALADATPLTFAALRSLLAAAALFVVLKLLRQPLAPRRGAALIALGLLQTTGFVGFVALALVSGAAGKSAVLAYTMPFWTLVLAGLMLGERVRGMQWAAVALAAAGLVGIVDPWRHAVVTADTLWALGAAFSWAGANVVVKRMDLEGGDLLNVSAWQMGIGALGLGALALFVGGADESVRWTLSFSIALGYNVVFATAIAWILWLYALNRLSAGAAGLASLGAPVCALAAAWLQLGERPSPAEAAGMALILAALAVLSLVGWRRFSRMSAGS